MLSVDQPHIMARGGTQSFAAGSAMDSAKMAMPLGGAGDGPTGQIRKEFPETWIWTSSVPKYVFTPIYVKYWNHLLFQMVMEHIHF